MAGGRRRFFVGASAVSVASGFTSAPDALGGFDAFVPGAFAVVGFAAGFASVDFAVVDFAAGLRARVVVPDPAVASGLTAGGGSTSGEL